MAAADLRDESVELLRRLIAVNTTNPPGGEAALARLLAGELAAAGLEVSVIDLGDGRANLRARLAGQRPRPALLWLGHLDTVPAGETGWTTDPFTAAIRDGRLFGRGASDMKSGLASMAVAAMSLARRSEVPAQDLILYFTADEEAGGLGARRLLDEPWLSGVGQILVGEPTGLNLGICEKGALWLEFTTTGRVAHGSHPERGRNAIASMHRLISGLLDVELGGTPHPLLGRSTLSLGTIAGGVKVNVVPDRCQLEVDIRLTPDADPEQLLARLRALLGRLSSDDPGFQAAFRLISRYPAFESDVRAPFVRKAREIGQIILGRVPEPVGISYFTDAAVAVAATGIPALILGPGEQVEAHGPDESLPLANLPAAVAYYQELARTPLPSNL